MAIKETNIPDELKQYQQWVVWKARQKDNGKIDKPPFDAKSGRSASHSNNKTWATFKQAMNTYANSNGTYAGIGYVFCKNDPYCGIDLDNCRDPETGKIAAWAEGILKKLDSYSEISPSSTGVKVFLKGVLSNGGRKKGNVEIYDNQRFFTVTGGWIGDYSGNIESRQEQITAIYNSLRPEAAKTLPQKEKVPTSPVADNKILDKLLSASNSEAILKLLKGDWQGDYPSQSEADQALCNHISFYCGGNSEQIDRIFRNSGLMRDKWDEKHYGDGRTYGQATIEKSIASTIKTVTKETRISGVLIQDIRDWIDTTEGEFQTSEVFDILNIPRHQKAQVSRTLTTLISEGLIERTGRRTGCFRRIEKTLQKMDIFATKDETVDIVLPFYISDMVEIMPGNIIVIAGAKDAGKTTFLLNIAGDNRDKLKVHYFNSEMGEAELVKRLRLFNDIPFNEWGKISFYERDENFNDVIVPGEGNLNIIDYLEMYEDFWLVRKRIAEIWRKLHGALAIVALQKPIGRDTGMGGEGTLEKARLALAINHGLLKIVSAKNWKGMENPRGKEIEFKLVQGSKLIQTG